ncbi:MAG TPA: FHA domain-containing protein [Candidatus Aphodovivens excrementavium]|nr:FHA domain-containing protein [Candidatus Aphodovivens excrementavium]
MTQLCPVCGSAMPADATSCAACGFKLQGATQSFQPINLDSDIADASVNEVKSKAILRVVRGPQTGVSFVLEKSPISVGRNPQCDIFLNDMTVSREHARIESVGSNWVITDTNSFNGVWVRNTSVERHTLEPGDIIQIGAFCLLFQVEQA